MHEIISVLSINLVVKHSFNNVPLSRLSLKGFGWAQPCILINQNSLLLVALDLYLLYDLSLALNLGVKPGEIYPIQIAMPSDVIIQYCLADCTFKLHK